MSWTWGLMEHSWRFGSVWASSVMQYTVLAGVENLPSHGHTWDECQKRGELRGQEEFWGNWNVLVQKVAEYWMERVGKSGFYRQQQIVLVFLEAHFSEKISAKHYLSFFEVCMWLCVVQACRGQRVIWAVGPLSCTLFETGSLVDHCGIG